jgi:hypothetical protein
MKNQWCLLSVLCFYMIVFIACLVTGFRDLRENRKQAVRRRPKDVFDLEKLCADFSRDDRVSDPYVLIHRRWVRQSPPLE